MTESLIKFETVDFAYYPKSKNPIIALKNINLEIPKGEYVVIIGQNGSGKTTLAKHLNALLIPTKGNVLINDINTKDKSRLRDIRNTVGMVFQIPDNQIVATTVVEDIAFGPENLGIAPEEIKERVDWALKVVDLYSIRNQPPHLLSPGQKQRVAIAGVMAMKPECLVLDESTTYLDPAGRREVLNVVKRLNEEEDVTIIGITHFMNEASMADRVIVLEKGQIVMQGTPREVFEKVEELRALKLDIPQVTELAYELHRWSSKFPANLITVNEIVKEVSQRIIITD